MSEFVRLAAKSEMPAESEAKEFLLGWNAVCVARISGELCAVNNECLHQGGPLADGTIEGGKIVCPWHGWEFDLKSGQATYPTSAKATVYPLKVEGEDVLIQM